MRDRPPTEAVALHGPLEALTLGDRGYVHLVPLGEDIRPDSPTDLARDASKLLQMPPRRSLVFLELARVRPVYLACRHRPETDLDRIVAVRIGRLHPRDEVRLDLDYGHAHQRAVVLKSLGH